jgi:hypothetical protein
MKVNTLYETVINYQKDNKVFFQNASNWDVRRFREMYSEGELVLQDWFQRDYCWSKSQVCALVHTLINTPTLLPEIVLIEINGKFYVADGHQRLRSIIKEVFDNVDFKYSSKELTDTTKYYNTSRQKSNWKDFTRELERKEITVKVIKNTSLDDNELRNLKSYVFKKWNNGKALNAAEKRGSFPSDLNINIIQNYKADIAIEKQQALLVSNSVGRNAFNEFIEKMFFHFIEKDTTKDPSEDGFEKIHDMDFSLRTGEINRFGQMFEAMVDVVYNFTNKNGKFSAGSCCLRDVLTFVNSLYAKKELKTIPHYKEYLNSILDVFHVVYVKNRGFKDYVAGDTQLSDAEAVSFWYRGFFSYFGKGQDSKFIHRRDFFNRNKDLFGSIEELDEKRIFSLSQRQFKYIEQNKKCLGLDGNGCANTEGELTISELHADHILEYSQGGTTTIDNLQLLCPKCHGKKTGDFNSKKFEEGLEKEVV